MPSDFPPQKTGSFSPFDLSSSPDLANDFFQTNGYLVLEKALSAAEVDALRAETVEFCRGRRGDLYRSAEENERFRAGVDDLGDDEVQARVLCIHHAHKVSPVMPWDSL